MRRALASLLLLSCALASADEHVRGVSLGLFSEDGGWSYAPLLDEVAALHATDVALVVPLYQQDVESTTVGYHPRFSPPLSAIRRTIGEARARHLRVLLFPIVRLVETHGPNEWRGTLRARDRAAWMASYGARLLELANLARVEHVDSLSIGSELSTMDVDHAAWAPLVEKVRIAFKGPLTYSGNWDHFEQVTLYDLVDVAGVCAYFPLTDHDGAPLPTLDALRVAWTDPAARLAALSARVERPIVVTELGYRSQPNALHEPYDEGAHVPVDALGLEAQRLGFASYTAAFSPRPSWLVGEYVWNWYGWGGAGSRSYTPRGKPAATVVERLLTRP
ncbi:MAG: hypothetical protein ABI321_06795 [Polyangia bacterium]